MSPEQKSAPPTSVSASPATTRPPFDPAARHVDQETGLEYEDIAAKIVGEPADSRRNVEVLSLRDIVVHPQAVTAWWQAHDAAKAAGDPSPFLAGYTAAREACHPSSYDHERFQRLVDRKSFSDALAEITGVTTSTLGTASTV